MSTAELYGSREEKMALLQEYANKLEVFEKTVNGKLGRTMIDDPKNPLGKVDIDAMCEMFSFEKPADEAGLETLSDQIRARIDQYTEDYHKLEQKR